MSINDFELIPDEVTSIEGRIVSKFLNAKGKLEYAMNDALDTSYEFGHTMGIADERERIIKWIDAHRRGLEVDAGIVLYRDSFDSESLLDFINSGEKHNDGN